MHNIFNSSFSPTQNNPNQTPTAKQDAPSSSSQQTISQSCQTSSLGGLSSLLGGGGQGASSQGSSGTSNWLSNLIGSWISDIFSQVGDSSSSSSSSTTQTDKNGGSSWWGTGSDNNGPKGSTGTSGTSGPQDSATQGSTSTSETNGSQDTSSTQTGTTSTSTSKETASSDDNSLMSYEDFVSSRFKSGEDTSIEAFAQYMSEEMGIPADNITVSADGQTILSNGSTSAGSAPELSSPKESMLSDLSSQSGFAPETTHETLPNGDIQEVYAQGIDRQSNDGEAFNLDEYIQDMSERFNVPLENISVNESNNTISIITNTIISEPSLSDVAQQEDTRLDDNFNPIPVPGKTDTSQTANNTQNVFNDIKSWW